MRYAKGAKMPRGSKPDILTYCIPVPPIKVQREIVRILDTFTALEAELVAELEARRVQYAHYRDKAFSLGSDVRWSTLGDVSIRVSSGGTPRKSRADYYENGEIPWLRTQEVHFNEIWKTDVFITEKAVRETSAKWIPANCVIVAISGATAARSAINKIPLTTNQHCCNFQIDPDQANFRYVFHWVSSRYEQLKSLGRGARSDLNVGIIKDFAIPLPSLPEQERIVEMLDKFDALTNDLSIGLPAEIEARRRQYEYYRDKLLTFQELTT
jgi:type I restriction enzyme, S subunit